MAGERFESAGSAAGAPVMDQAWVRSGVAAAVTGMVCWVVGVALIPVDAKLANGNLQLAGVLRSHSTDVYVAGLLAVVGAVLLASFFAVLTRLVPEGQPGWGWLRVSLAACVITQTMVCVGASFGLAGVHAAVANADAGLVAFAWRGLWLTFLASAVPTVAFTLTGLFGLAEAGMSRPWVSALGWLSAAAHVLVLFTFAQRGVFAPDGTIAALVPLTTVVWIVAQAAVLPASWRSAAARIAGTRGGARTLGV